MLVERARPAVALVVAGAHGCRFHRELERALLGRAVDRELAAAAVEAAPVDRDAEVLDAEVRIGMVRVELVGLRRGKRGERNGQREGAEGQAGHARLLFGQRVHGDHHVQPRLASQASAQAAAAGTPV